MGKRRIKQSNSAVSEVLGTVLLLGIAVSLFSVVGIIVLSYPFQPLTPSANIIGFVDGNNIILEHRGGEPLDLDTQILITVGGKTLLINNKIPTVKDLLDNESKDDDNLWGMGETLRYSSNATVGNQITISVVDMVSNSIVMMGTLQEGASTPPSLDTYVNTIDPYQQTISPLNITVNGDSRLDYITLKYRYSSDGSSWSAYSTFNVDTSPLWEYHFDFPNGLGYYEFYSIGTYLGDTENPPVDADAECSYFHIPIISGPYPSDGATNIPLNPTLHITVSDLDGEAMDIIWYSNSSGSWQQFGTNTSVYNGTYYMTNSDYSDYEQTYYWNVSVSDGTTTVYSSDYHFTTQSANSLPNAPINPVPSDGAYDISLNPSLSVDVSDPNGDSMDVSFFDASTHIQIGATQIGIPNGSKASVTWSGLTYLTSYSWYAVANDNIAGTTQSATWSFTTEQHLCPGQTIYNYAIDLNTVVLDRFGTASYGNSDGTVFWDPDWVESDGGGNGATGGDIQIIGGELRITHGYSSLPSIRRTVDLSGYMRAILSFDYRTSSGVDSDDNIVIEVSRNGGGSYNLLETFAHTSGSVSYDISSYIASNTMIRFRVYQNYGGSNEYFYADNVQIAFATTPTAHESDVDRFPYQSSGDQNDFQSPDNTEYGNIAVNNSNYWQTDDPGSGNQIFVQFDMVVNEDIADITQIDFTFIGYTNGGNTEHRIYAQKTGTNLFEASSWDQIGTSQSIPASKTTMTRSITSGFADYIDPVTGKITWGVYETRSSEHMLVYYVEMKVTTLVPC